MGMCGDDLVLSEFSVFQSSEAFQQKSLDLGEYKGLKTEAIENYVEGR